jgi:hypothetical protein
MVEVIFRPAGVEMDDEGFGRAQTLSVLALTMPAMALEGVLTTKLLALDEHSLDYGQLLAMARAVREQVDWPVLARRTVRSPYARRFFTLMRVLGIADIPDSELIAARRGVPALAPDGPVRVAPARSWRSEETDTEVAGEPRGG